MENIFLTDSELRRYKKQIEILETREQGQLKLKQARVLVIGAGGLGTPVMQYLAAAGIGTIGICDAEYVDESNLYRQIMYGTSDLGKLKTIVAKEKLSLLNPTTHFEILNIYITEENVEEIIAQYKIVIDCSNNISVTHAISQACTHLSIPVVWASVSGFKGFVSVLDNTSLEKLTIHPHFKKINSSIGTIGIISGIIGSLQANEVVKLLLHTGEPLLGKLLIFDGLKSEFKSELL